MSKALATRMNILQQAFRLVYQKGYQATSIDDIIATTQVTKGAFFYHFKNKEEMGLAIIREIMFPAMHESFAKPLLNEEDPAKALYQMMKSILLEDPFFDVKYGCPTVNLVEEMSPLNEAFHTELSRLMQQTSEAIQIIIVRGQVAGKIRKEVHPKQVAHFIMAGYSGTRNLGKIFGTACYHTYLRELKLYLGQLS